MGLFLFVRSFDFDSQQFAVHRTGKIRQYVHLLHLTSAERQMHNTKRGTNRYAHGNSSGFREENISFMDGFMEDQNESWIKPWIEPSIDELNRAPLFSLPSN